MVLWVHLILICEHWFAAASVLHAVEDTPVLQNQKRKGGDGSVQPGYVLWGECDSYCSKATELPSLLCFPLLFSMVQQWLLLLAVPQVRGTTSTLLLWSVQEI